MSLCVWTNENNSNPYLFDTLSEYRIWSFVLWIFFERRHVTACMDQWKWLQSISFCHLLRKQVLEFCLVNFLFHSCIIRFWFSRFAIWKAFYWFFQVVNLERRVGSHRLWVNFHEEGSRPRTGVIFGACTCRNQGLGAPCKSWREFSKHCTKKVSLKRWLWHPPKF